MRNSELPEEQLSIDAEHAAILTGASPFEETTSEETEENSGPWEEVNLLDKHDAAAKFAREDSIKKANEVFPKYECAKYDKDGVIISAPSTATNLERMVKSSDYELAISDMDGEIHLLKNGTVKIDHLDLIKSELLSISVRKKLNKSAVIEHLFAVASKTHYHPVKNYLNGHVWDGEERVDRVLAAIPAKDKELCRKVMKIWLVSAIAAIYHHTFKSKLVPVLAGPQSAKKSNFIQRLFSGIPLSYSSGLFNPEDNRHIKKTLEVWCREFDEIDKTINSWDASSFKQFIYNSSDKIEHKYVNKAVDKRRQTVFIGTTNHLDLLKDPTGNDRFAVFGLEGDIDIDRVNEVLGFSYDGSIESLDRPEELRQFWLEVYELYRNKHPWSVDEKTLNALRESNRGLYTNKGECYNDLVDFLYSDTEGLEIGAEAECDESGRPVKNGGYYKTKAEIKKHLDLRYNDRQITSAMKLLVEDLITVSKYKSIKNTNGGKTNSISYWVPQHSWDVIKPKF